jgi:hypothetical protein
MTKQGKGTPGKRIIQAVAALVDAIHESGPGDLRAARDVLRSHVDEWSVGGSSPDFPGAKHTDNFSVEVVKRIADALDILIDD